MPEIICALTMGDPAGIGPEIIIKSISGKNLPQECIPVIIGNEAIFRKYRDLLKADIEFKKIRREEIPLAGKMAKKNCFAVIEPDSEIKDSDITAGNGNKYSGRMSFDAITEAINLAKSGAVNAVCTAPISKSAIHDADILFPGHTEILAYYTRTKNYAMLLQGGGLKVILATIHIGLKEVFKSLNSERILTLLKLIKKFFRYYGIENARIGVAGLNPHAGENGLFGKEEIKIIKPAIESAVKLKINAAGPFPSDTIFFRMLEGDFDAVLAMYHDQALIPVKTLDFHNGVNITMGLTFIRTSPDHGTAFDKAGKGISKSGSMEAAIKTACLLAKNKMLIDKTNKETAS